MSKVEPHAPLSERQEAMHRLWPDCPRWCTQAAPNTGGRDRCGVEVVPLTVSPTYLSLRCPSCRVLTIHHRVHAPFQYR